ncbi:unnamed protein product [Echinostoma caproni]|uniref:Phospholipid scramblase n=1 Tax=Echinostoma caproni TaxID=27848 RepID=A0A183A9W8_9TREM|nr:unnamed protein product [Echinostoma caproni]
MWRDAEHGGGIGAPKNKSKPADPNDHRGLLPPLSPWSFRPWTRRLGAAWRYTLFWLRSTPEVNDTLMLTAGSDSNPSFFRVNAEIPTAQSSQSMVHRRIRSKYGRLVYTPACDGCSKCWPNRIEHLQSTSDLGVSTTPKSESTFSRMFGLSRAKSVGSGLSNQMHQKRLPSDRSHIQNEECGREYTVDLRDTAGVVMTLDGENVRVQIVPTPKGFFSYMRETFSWLRLDSYRANLIDEPQSLRCATVRLYPQITQNEFYWIDNDHFEACPVEVRVRINAIDFYRESCPQPDNCDPSFLESA